MFCRCGLVNLPLPRVRWSLWSGCESSQRGRDFKQARVVVRFLSISRVMGPNLSDTFGSQTEPGDRVRLLQIIDCVKALEKGNGGDMTNIKNRNRKGTSRTPMIVDVCTKERKATPSDSQIPRPLLDCFHSLASRLSKHE